MIWNKSIGNVLPHLLPRSLARRRRTHIWSNCQSQQSTDSKSSWTGEISMKYQLTLYIIICNRFLIIASNVVLYGNFKGSATRCWQTTARECVYGWTFSKLCSDQAGCCGRSPLNDRGFTSHQDIMDNQGSAVNVCTPIT